MYSNGKRTVILVIGITLIKEFILVPYDEETDSDCQLFGVYDNLDEAKKAVEENTNFKSECGVCGVLNDKCQRANADEDLLDIIFISAGSLSLNGLLV
ncbi:MAG: hypothetical protein GX638_02185 [Crenarchaeota archaeon]|nr:hypothetical protein [Thermoproteota archaeon]